MKNGLLGKTLTAVLLLVMMVISQSVSAHNLRMSVYVEGNTLEGELYYVGGKNPTAVGASVQLLRNGQVVANTLSDEDGWFLFEFVEAADYVVKGDAGQGHATTFEVTASDFPAAVKSSPAQSEETSFQQTSDGGSAASISQEQLELAITQAIRPLRQQIDRYEAKTRLHDILGGIGYILGLFGMFVLIKQRKA